jgi:Stress responsive A/B Barrel Domain
MILHVVLFEPRPDLSADAMRDLIASIERAAAEIPSVRRFEVGRRLADGPAYLVAAPPALSYVAIVGFDDRAGLDAYLAHEAHVELGRLFNQTLSGAFVYDYEAWGAEGAERLLRNE